MEQLALFLKYLAKVGIPLKSIFSKPFAFIACFPVLTLPAFTTPQKALILLGGLFVIDFITGIWANWIEFKRDWPIDPVTGEKERLIKSSKLRLSAVKFGTYGIMILCGYGLEWVFAPGEFEPHVRLQKMTLPTIVIAFCCFIELYSIVFENIKRMGIDVILIVKKIAASGWGIYNTIKNKKDETE